MRLLPLLVLLPALASAQTLPLRLPSFPNPPESNGANPTTYPNGLLYNPALACVQGATGTTWDCFARAAQLAAVAAQAAAAQSTASAAVTAAGDASASASAAQLAANEAHSLAQDGVDDAATARDRADAAHLVGTNAGATADTARTEAAGAQTTANTARSEAAAVATNLAALVTRVGLAEAALAVLQAQPRALCTSVTLTGLSIPLTGISSTFNFTLTGAPAGTSCRVGIPSFAPLGAKPVVVIGPAGAGQGRWEGTSSLLSGVLNIPNGAYRICCDS